jgi:uncharacterized phage protein gp47/JayE
MPVTPNTVDVSDSIVAQLEVALSQAIPLLPKAFTRVLAKALAAFLVILYKYAGFIFLQMYAAYASAEETEVNGRTIRPLIELGRLVGVGDPDAPTRAELVAAVTVTNQTGQLDANAQLLYAPTGIVYLTVAAVALDAPTVNVSVRASSDPEGNGGAGSIGNRQPGDVLQFASPLPNVASDVVVASVTTTGADAEDIELSYRPKVIGRFQARPQGGAYADYRVWGEEPAGILHVYPYTSDTPGEVDNYVEATEESSGSPDGIPTSDQLAAVRASIERTQEGLASRRPANAGVNVYPITRWGFDVTVLGLLGPDVPAAQVDIETALDEHLRSLEPFIEGLSALPSRNIVSREALGGIAYEAATGQGATFGSLVMFRAGSLIEINSYMLDHGEKAKLSGITFG